MSKKHTAVYNMVVYALFAAIIAVMSQLAIPMPLGVPITLQTFALCLCGYFLGARAVIPTLVYIAMGAVGLPVFANFTGGFAKLSGPTGGFIYGFVFLSLLCGVGIMLSEKLKYKASSKKSTFSLLAASYIIPISFGLIGMIVCHLLGIIMFSRITDTSFVKSALAVSVPWYFAKDVATMILALIISKTLKKRIFRR